MKNILIPFFGLLLVIAGCGIKVSGEPNTLEIKHANIDKLRKTIHAVHSFHDHQRRLPARFSENTAGQRLLSWRVHILPMLGERKLYDEFKLHQPWDSPHNKALISKMPRIYVHSGGDATLGKTFIVAAQGKGVIFSNPRQTCNVREFPQSDSTLENIIDGTSRTAMLFSLDPAHAVTWTRPEDLEWESGNPVSKLLDSEGLFLVGMADSTVLQFKSNELQSHLGTIVQGSDGNWYQPPQR